MKPGQNYALILCNDFILSVLLLPRCSFFTTWSNIKPRKFQHDTFRYRDIDFWMWFVRLFLRLKSGLNPMLISFFCVWGVRRMRFKVCHQLEVGVAQDPYQPLLDACKYGFHTEIVTAATIQRSLRMASLGTRLLTATLPAESRVTRPAINGCIALDIVIKKHFGLFDP